MKIDEIFNIRDNKPRILLAPLDWGLGHATRCIPVITKLLQQNCDVLIAAEGHIKHLLQKEFPNLVFIPLKGYRMQYSRNGFWLPLTLLMQLPKFLFRVYAERQWLNKTVEVYKINAVIADNRPGLSHKKIPCIYITHQLLIKTGNRFTENIAQKIHYHFINKFSACWVPDAEGKINLAGDLSHPGILPKTPVTYLGPLSRFEKITAENKFDCCILLSGPEPQRSIFENILLRDLKTFSGSVFLVRGLPGQTAIPILNNPAIIIKNHLTAGELNQVLLQSKIMICRSGYTSVMDLVKLQKKAILVPTPRQTEQEYLASYLQKQQIFLCVKQKGFSLPVALQAAAAFNFKALPLSQNSYEQVIENFTAGL